MIMIQPGTPTIHRVVHVWGELVSDEYELLSERSLITNNVCLVALYLFSFDPSFQANFSTS